MPSLNSTLLSSCCHRVSQDYTQLSNDSPEKIKASQPSSPVNVLKKDKRGSLISRLNFLQRWRSLSKDKADEKSHEDRDLDKNIKLILAKAVRSLTTSDITQIMFSNYNECANHSCVPHNFQTHVLFPT